MVKLKRVYEDAKKDDGYRILVDRLWPRGISKNEAKIDLWLKDIAPSNELRKWFAHDPKKWHDFQKKYRLELKNKKELIAQILLLEKKEKTVTLLYAAKDAEHNNAVVLVEKLKKGHIA